MGKTSEALIKYGLVGLGLGFFPDVEQKLSHGLELRDPDVPRVALRGGVSLEYLCLSLLGHVLRQ